MIDQTVGASRSEAPRRFAQIGRGLALLALVVSMSFTTGCNRLLANLSLSQAKENVAEARDHDAQQFDAQGLAEVESKISSAESLLNAKSNAEARTIAREAAEGAEALLESTILDRANFLKGEANRWIGILDTNDGRQENPVRYLDVLADNDSGLKEFEDQKFEDAIDFFAVAVDDAELILANLKLDAQQGRDEIEKKKEDLIGEGADVHYPEGVIELDDFLAQLDNLIVDKMDYRTALLVRDQANQAQQESILRTKENKCDLLLRGIESMLSEAVTRGAEIYAPQTLENVTREFEDLLKQFYEQKYETVLVTGPTVVPLAEGLLLETKKESALSKIGDLNRAITGLVEGKAPVYLPGRVDRLRQILASAQADFDNQLYEDTEKKAIQGLEEEQKIIEEFDDVAQREIANASTSMTVAESVFNTSEEIFSMPSAGPMQGKALAVEKSKKALRERLRALIQNMRLELGLATLKRDEQTFFQAIEISRAVIQEAGEVTRETYGIVAHHTAQELSAELRHLEEDGGRAYVPAAAAEAAKAVNNIRGLMRDGQYRGAVEMASDAKAQMEILSKELVRIAQGKVNEARAARDQARRYRAMDFRPDALARVDKLIDQAQGSLDAAQRKDAIETADKAAAAATQVGQESITAWTEEDMREADETITKAREANTSKYAGEPLAHAEEFRLKADQFLQAGDIPSAQKAAAECIQLANQALYWRVNAAEIAIAEAHIFQGWRYAADDLVAASNDAKTARQLMDQGNYSGSHSKAQSALRVADDVSLRSRNQSFQDRLTVLQSRVDLASQEGAAFFQVRDLQSVVRELESLRQDFNPDDFESATERLDLLDAKLKELMRTTPDVLKELVNNLNATMTELEDRGARVHTPDLVARVDQKVRFAQLDFQNGKYRGSFSNAKKAIELLGMIEAELRERDFDREMGEFFIEYSRTVESFRQILEWGSTVMIRIIEGPNGRAEAVALLTKTDPVEFREDVRGLLRKVSMMKPPPSRKQIHRQTIDFVRLTEKGAAKFEKMLIMDQYSMAEARKLIETAFLDIRAARGQQRRVQHHLETTVPEIRQIGIQRVH